MMVSLKQLGQPLEERVPRQKAFQDISCYLSGKYSRNPTCLNEMPFPEVVVASQITIRNSDLPQQLRF